MSHHARIARCTKNGEAALIELFESKIHRERLQAAGRFVASYGPSTELLLIGSTRESLDDFVRSELASGGATFGLHRFSLMQLASHLGAGAMAAAQRAPATLLGMEAVAARAAFEAEARNEMPRFTAVAHYPGFPRALAATLVELRLAGVQEQATPSDFRALLGHYDAALASAGIADRSMILKLGRAGLERPENARLRRMPLVFLDVALTNPLERDLAAELCRASPAALATLPPDDVRTRAAWLDIGASRKEKPHAAAPRKAPSRTGRAQTRAHASHESNLLRLRTHLFSEARPPDHDADDSVRFFSAPGEGRECVEIARLVLQEAERGVPFDAMAVVLRTPEVYSTFLDTALRRAEIPSWFARGTQRPDAAGRAFLALLDCRCEGLSARRFAEYLSFAQVPQPEPSGAPPPQRDVWAPPEADELGATTNPANLRTKGIEPAATPGVAVQLSLWDQDGAATSSQDEIPAPREDNDTHPELEGTLRAPWKWEELLVEAAVMGGKERWRRRLRGLSNELRLQLDALRDVEPESPRLPALERDLNNLGHLERFALPVIDVLDAWPERGTWGDWVTHLMGLAPRVVRRPERVLAVLGEMQPMAKVGPVTLNEVREVLTDRLALLEQNPPESRFGRVFVATPEQLRGRSFRVVFVPGLAERLFPQRPREDPLLLDALRQEISAHLRTQAERGHDERLLLQLALGAAEERVVLSYPRLDAVEARPRVPSFYALDMARATRGAIPDFETLEREAADVVQARLAWPSPPEAHSAIDAIEHDLAVLGSFLHAGDASKARGRARYLLELSAELARSLRARWLRWNSVWRPQDGLVRTNEITEPLFEAQRPTVRPYSVTALQKFAACPYQFVLAAIHRLEPRRDAVPVVQLDPLTRGRIFHHVQAEALRTLRDAGRLPLAESASEDAQRVLDATLDRLAGAYRDDLVPAIERIWDDEIDSMRADLRRWLRAMTRESATWTPLHFELTFGLGTGAVSDHDKTDPGGRAGAAAAAFSERGTPDPVRLPEGYLLRGAVDLVEENVAARTLRVTDHKTGRNRTSVGMVVGRGETLQPVLYALAVQQILQRDVAEGRLYYCTSRGGFSERVVPISEFARLYADMVLKTLDRSVEKGFLPPAPRRDACTFCDFRIVCGPHEETRCRRKAASTLQYLDELRTLP